MPELPEVETIKLQLNQVLPKLEIKSIEVRTAKMFQGDKNRLVGLAVEKVERRGKMILIKFQNPKNNNNFQLLIHLKLTGRLIFDKKEYDRDKHTHVVITFTNGRKLYFWDLRKFGWIKIITNPPAGRAGYELQITNYKLGVDPLTKEFTEKYFASLLSKSKKPIKILLMEQEKIAGIGNIYANEALFCAGIDPREKANSISKKRAEKLYRCIKEALAKGLRYNGASDDSFRLIDGSMEMMQKHFFVYGKEKENCPRNCGAKIQRIALSGRGTFFCPKCQI